MFPAGVIIPAHVSLEFIGAVYQAGALKMVDVYPVVSSARFEDCYNSSQSVDILRIQVAIGEGFAGEGDELASASGDILTVTERKKLIRFHLHRF